MIEKLILPTALFFIYPTYGAIADVLKSIAMRTAKRKALGERPDLAHTGPESLSDEQWKEYQDVLYAHYDRHPAAKLRKIVWRGSVGLFAVLTSLVGAGWLIVLLGLALFDLIKPLVEKIL